MAVNVTPARNVSVATEDDKRGKKLKLSYKTYGLKYINNFV